MKKPKAYRPRRGLRVANGRTGGPAANFVTDRGASIDPVVMTGSVATQIAQLDTGFRHISSSISYGSVRQSRLCNRALLGASNQATGAPYSSVISAVTASSPSWANSQVSQQAFVNLALATGSVEGNLNYFRSGTQPLESSPVPASASLFYAKTSKYSTLVVKKTASVFDTWGVGTTIPNEYMPVTFVANSGTSLTFVTGVYNPDLIGLIDPTAQTIPHVYAPACFTVEVPQSGKIVDLKVWVEIVHVSSSSDNTPLAELGIALRSPNVSFGHAHPIRNSAELQAVYNSTTAHYSFLSLYGGDTGKKWFKNPPHRFYHDTFLLWEGSALFNFNDPTAPVMRRYPCFSRDRSIRTVFSDGSPVPNPRHIVSTTTANNYNGAPHTAVQASNLWTVLGGNAPWTSDETVPTGGGAEPYRTAGSPPYGWLTAPGPVADVNEWPTTGSNYGTNTIQPLYPLMDAIIQTKRVTDEFDPLPVTGTEAQFNPSRWIGMRPGLRGTEMSGTWKLLICSNSNATAYFRQFRLEFTYESNAVRPNHTRVQSRLSPRRAGRRYISSISGSDQISDIPEAQVSWDAWVNETYVDDPMDAEIGRTFGIRLNTGSFISTDYALLYRLTGTLADASGSAPGWLLNNPFGMPSIPESSASLVPYVEYATPAIESIHAVVSPTRVLDGPRRLADVASDINPRRTLADLAIAFVSSSAT